MACKLLLKRKECIGAGQCEAISPQIWKVMGDGKAELRGATLNPKTGMYELVVDDALLKTQKIVAGSCPVGCISLEKS
ncbi:MAG: ferredoxin [Candidatus Aenigmarchaeota archaeon]|nr:ferredoxin [Candidatus Aenigmarchaeota archaeon]